MHLDGSTAPPGAGEKDSKGSSSGGGAGGGGAAGRRKDLPKRYRQLLEVTAKLHPEGWMQFAAENPQHALKLVQCKLDDGEVLAVHQMMAAVQPKTALDKLCNCQPCADERARAKAAAEKKAQEDRVAQQLAEMRAQSHR